MSKYVFNPCDYGFLPPNKIPRRIKSFLGKNSFIKVICTSGDSFWFTYCRKMSLDDRWEFGDGANELPCHIIYSGCITSARYAKSLLTHLLGTPLNKYTLKYGKERLLATSVKIPRKKSK